MSHFKQLAGGCQDELSRGVRRALWAFKLGAPLTKVCDSDVLVSWGGNQGGSWRLEATLMRSCCRLLCSDAVWSSGHLCVRAH